MKLFFLSISLFMLTSCSAFPPKEAIEMPQPSTSSGKLHGHADVTAGEIAPAALHDKIQKGEKIVILDIRDPEEFEEAHIAQTTLLIPLKKLSYEELNKAGIKEDDEIIVYCRSGKRSKVAAQFMRGLGFKNVRELNSGLIHWMEDGFPVESGKKEQKTIQKDSAQEYGDSPTINFDRTSHDFGEIPQFGGTVETTFTIKNTGKGVLEIGQITTSCACTTAKIEKLAIGPGQETALQVIFNPNLHEEPEEKFQRTIFIPTNDPQNKDAELTISVDILEGK